MIVLSVQLKVRQVLKVQMRHAKQVQAGAVKMVATAMVIIATKTIQNQKIKLR
jgi:hypothetical protein